MPSENEQREVEARLAPRPAQRARAPRTPAGWASWSRRLLEGAEEVQQILLLRTGQRAVVVDDMLDSELG